MNKILVATALVLLLSCSLVVEAKKLRSHQAPLRNSKPYSDILEKAKKLMGGQNVQKIEHKLKDLKNMSQQQIVDYFVNHQYTDVQDYWFQYYLLSELLLFTDSNTWLSPTKSQINDPFYDEFVQKDAQYAQNLQSCKDQSNSFITENSSEHLELGENGTLYDLEYTYETLELIEQDVFYNHVYSNLPKGVIHHLHWSAGTDYSGFITSIRAAINSQPYDSERIVVVSVQVYLEDATVGKVATEKYYNKYFLTKQKYVDPSNVQSVIDANQDVLNQFAQNVKDNKKCLNYIKDNNGFNPGNLDPYIRGFVYWKSCNGSIYDDGMNQEGQAKSLEELSDMLKESIACFQTDEQAIKRLPKSYLKDNAFETKETKEILGVWFFFEQIFQSVGELQDNQNIFQQLTTNMFMSFKDQNTYGVEFRNKNDKFQIGAFQQSSDEFEIPFSFITPGRKVAGKGSKGGAVVQAAPKITDPHFVGIDFFAFEDDPYNGARNFFPGAFTDVIKGETQSYFDQMFNYLNNQDGKIYLHAGETQFFPQGGVDSRYTNKNYINDNLIHAALLPGVKRIGHGFEAYKNNLLLSIINQKNISFESCPISNQVLNFNEVYTNPFLSLLRNGLHMAISPDDPGLFGYIGVAMDWFYVLMETDIKPSEVYLLLKNSIEYSSIKEIRDNSQQYLQRLRDDLDAFFSDLPQVCPADNNQDQ
ncbi:hypothetical protein ABPG74_002006 [Tetrahymena malaccensis]